MQCLVNLSSINRENWNQSSSTGFFPMLILDT